MKILCLIFLIAPFYLLGQQVYFSPYTQSFPTGLASEIEDINRRITFEPNTITIATETEQGKEIEVLSIEATDYVNENIVFLCQDRSKRKITIAVPEQQEKVEIIDYYYRSPKTNEEVQLRFHVEQL